MAETTFKFDEKTFVETLSKAESYFQQFAGKKDHNPFYKLNEIAGLKKSYEKGDRTEKLFLAAKSIKLVPPTITTSAPVQEDNQSPVTAEEKPKVPEVTGIDKVSTPVVPTGGKVIQK